LYTVVIKGKPQGPYSLEELKKMEILPDTFVRKPGMDDYKEAHELEELRQLMGFGIPKNLPQYFAGFDQRLMAWAIDIFLITLVYAIIAFVSIVFVEDKEQRLAIFLSAVVLVPITKFLYNVIADASKKHGTIGKRLMAIKVTDENGIAINIGTALIRNLCKIVSIATLGFGYLYSFMNKKQQCLHDVMAGTLVVKDRLL
jgi:uncharacterized RDD family membrane protein YckC